MKYVVLIIATVSCMSCSKAQIESLDDFKWKNRLLIIYTHRENQSSLENQLADIKKARKAYHERELKVIILKNQEVEIWNSSASHQLDFDQIVKDLNISTGISYQNLLIGKDGGVKLRKDSPIFNQKLFNTIDTMPMRKREMRDGD